MKPSKELVVVGILYGVMEWLFLGLAYLGNLPTVFHPNGVALYLYLGIAGAIVSAVAAYDAFGKAGVFVSSTDTGEDEAECAQPTA